MNTSENSTSNKRQIRFASKCKSEIVPIMDALYIINGKWRISIVLTLMEGNKRFSEIQKEVQKITSKVLADELKEMELNGFVEKKIDGQSRAKTEYQLTDYSSSLEPIIKSLRDFGLQHRKKIRDESYQINKIAD
ncbi:putative HTH-type transcriptional regulator YybR [Flavobacterium sp. ACN2]|uniref:winged helix-turn-helix transcriptional regulator n=1 Tax=unclassified Flavobacterium TaxID=196869 RepID=UPI000BB359EF|nr:MULTISPECIES: helix-turn-helix domain-containing protein [unclassified Flavobacterium]MDY0989436.1 helix-turn-helix domain-containing protein [Flavobacterium sp. CFBP9031]PBI83761.1 putative HTH-type transcriptional regulator YybR [Flavobacterium sp. ACN2]